MQYQEIPVENIIVSATNPRRHVNESKMQELSESIATYGVIQPITVRPRMESDTSQVYEIVAGERRYHATEAAGLDTIPAVVRDLTDAEMFDIQIIENLQREDVHPLDEAYGFQKMRDRGYVLEEIADRVGKSDSYVTKRLKLTDLVQPAQEGFYDDRMLLGHALEMCRLPAEDQRALYYDHFAADANFSAPSIGRLRSIIENSYLRKISAAEFQASDPELYPEAGPCTICPKRSGANMHLFPDIEDEDRCFDSACFEEKQKRDVIQKIEAAKEDEQVVYFVRTGFGEVDPEVKEVATQDGHTVLEQYDDFMDKEHVDESEARKKGYPRGLYINGSKIGKKLHIELRKKAQKKASENLPRDEEIKQEIERIEERAERAVELDREKVQKRLIGFLEDQKEKLIDVDANLGDEYELRLAICYLTLDSLGYSGSKPEYYELLGMDVEETKNEYGYISTHDVVRFLQVTYPTLEELKPRVKQLLRITLLESFTPPSLLDPEDASRPYIFREFAKAVSPDTVDQFIGEQEAEAQKRRVRTEGKLDSLRTELESLESGE